MLGFVTARRHENWLHDIHGFSFLAFDVFMDIFDAMTPQQTFTELCGDRYEDDGATREYLTGEFVTTNASYVSTETALTFTVASTGR